MLLYFRLISVRVPSIDPKICDIFSKTKEGSAAKELSGGHSFRLRMEFSSLISAPKFVPSVKLSQQSVTFKMIWIFSKYALDFQISREF
jgi:hypothetical protein